MEIGVGVDFSPIFRMLEQPIRKIDSDPNFRKTQSLKFNVLQAPLFDLK